MTVIFSTNRHISSRFQVPSILSELVVTKRENYRLEQSRSHRILFLLEELRLPYKLKTYTRNPLTNLAGSSLKQVHPLGKFPVIEVIFPESNGGNQEPLVIAESAVIVEYLVENFGRHMLPCPPSTSTTGDGNNETEDKHSNSTDSINKDWSRDWLRYKYFLNYAEGSIMNVLLIAVMVTCSFSPSFP